MSNVLTDPPADWLHANGFLPEGVAFMNEESRQALRLMYQSDLDREAARHPDPFNDKAELIDVPSPDYFSDILPDYSTLPPGVEPGSREHAEYDRFLENHYGYNQPDNSEIAA